MDYAKEEAKLLTKINDQIESPKSSSNPVKYWILFFAKIRSRP